MSRYTHAEALRCFERLRKLLGKRRAISYRDVGAWQLSYKRGAGGYVIEEIVGEDGAVTEPFGGGRRSTEAFCRMTLDVQAAAKICDARKSVSAS